MDQTKIDNLKKDEYTHLPHADQDYDAHEQTDVHIAPLVYTMVAIFVVLAFSYVAMYGTFRVFKYQIDNEPGNQKLTAFESEDRFVPKGYPELQGVQMPGRLREDGTRTRTYNANTPAQDMRAFRDANALIMNGAAPMRDGGKNGMAIALAIDTALERKMFKTRPMPASGTPAPKAPPSEPHDVQPKDEPSSRKGAGAPSDPADDPGAAIREAVK